MDGIMMYRIVECLQSGLPLDQNLYEGCFWSAVTELSGKSIDQEGAPKNPLILPKEIGKILYLYI
tara:strand:- start:64 stop:258 length:195 start_codon:yes stop_codon:yes gene_type:complete